MVTFRLFFTLLLLPLALFGAELSVTLDNSKVAAGAPLEGTLTVKHKESEKVDVDSFRLNGKQLPVQLVKSAPGLSLYRFSLPTEGSGLMTLSPISANIGGKELQTSALTYEVGAGFTNDLRIEGFIIGSNRLYPGQTRTFGYRYIYSRPVDITEESLPLLEPDGFKKIGTIKVTQRDQGNTRITEMTQKVKAVEPGNYSFGPSYAAGNGYTLAPGGRRLYSNLPVRAEAPAIDVVVEPFPEKGKPPAFNGAIGSSLNFKVQLLSYPEMRVEDKMTLSVTISGEGDLSDIPLPELCCQPGFPGNFKLGDIPPAASMYDGAKVFVVEMRPLSPSLREIPPIFFSYYNPEKSSYSTLKTDPIPIKVLPIPKLATPPTESTGTPQEGAAADWPSEGTPLVKKKSSSPLAIGDLFNRYFTQWILFFLIPFAAGFLTIAYMRRKNKLPTPQKEKEEKQEPLAEAFALRNDPARFYRQLNGAFLKKLYNAGLIPSEQIAPQQLPDQGLCGEVRQFLCTIEERRFSGQEKIDFAALEREAQALYAKIKELRT